MTQMNFRDNYQLLGVYLSKPERPDVPKVGFEMTLQIKPNNEPFYFRPGKIP